jgi:hypothetical protein
MLCCSPARALMYVHVHSALSPTRASPETDLTAKRSRHPCVCASPDAEMTANPFPPLLQTPRSR